MDEREKKTKNIILDKLKSLCDEKGREINPAESAKCLLELADDIKKEKYKLSYIYRSTLLNGVLRRITDADERKNVEEELRFLGYELLKEANAKYQDIDLVEESRKIKESLEKRRSEIKKDLDKIENIPWEISGEELRKREDARIVEIEKIMEKANLKYDETMKEISDTCMAALGKSPCRFSHFAMGSLARQESTLYSDFENAILLDDEALPEIPLASGKSYDQIQKVREKILEYFRWYTVLFDAILINFGETLIRLVGMDSLNDSDSEKVEEEWFFDRFTPRGMMFHSTIPYIDETSFARLQVQGRGHKNELILPVTEMLVFLNEGRLLTEDNHLADMLIETKHVAGNEEVLKEFQLRSMEKMRDLTKCTHFIKYSLKNIRSNLDKFDVTPVISSLGWKKNVKKSFYRPITIFLPFLAKILQIGRYRSTSEIVKKFQSGSSSDGKKISDEVAHNLLYAVAIANHLRLKVYSERHQKDDVMAGTIHLLPDNDNSQSRNFFDAIGKRSVIDCYEISISLWKAMKKICESVNFAVNEGRMDWSQLNLLGIVEAHLASRHDLVLCGDLLRNFQDFETAIQCYNEAVETNQHNNAEIFTSLGICCLHLLKYHDGIKYFEKGINLERLKVGDGKSSFNLAFGLTMIGQCFTQLPHERLKFASHLEEAVKHWQALIDSDPRNKGYIRGMAEARDTEAWFAFQTDDFEKSLKKYFEATDLFLEFYGYGVENNDTLKVQNGIALCLLNLKRYEEAIVKFTDVLDMKQNMIGKEVADVNVSVYLRNIADCMKELDKYEEAITTYEKSLYTREAALGSKAEKNCAKANTTCRMADCYLRMKKYDEAVAAAEKAFVMAQEANHTNGGKYYMGYSTSLKQKIERQREEEGERGKK